MYGSSPYGNTEYAGLSGGSPVNNNPEVNLDDLGIGGRLTLVLSLLFPNVNGVNVNLDDLGDGGRFILYLNRTQRESGEWFADAGELWKRVPLHSQSNFLP